jgi:hypothetical protein
MPALPSWNSLNTCVRGTELRHGADMSPAYAATLPAATSLRGTLPRQNDPVKQRTD